MKTTNNLLVLAIGLAGLCGINAIAKDLNIETPTAKALKRVPPAEMPARAAQMVKQAKQKDLDTTTIAVIKASVEMNPASTPLVVGSVCKAVTAVAPLAAATAAALQPAQAAAITKSAVAAAPSQAGKIVQAVCKEVPAEHRSIAMAANQAAPGSGKEILQGVASALPTFKPSIDKALAVYSGTIPPVAIVLDQAAVTRTPSVAMATISVPRPPTTDPPYLPLGGTPRATTPSDTGLVPPGGRDYSGP